MVLRQNKPRHGASFKRSIRAANPVHETQRTHPEWDAVQLVPHDNRDPVLGHFVRAHQTIEQVMQVSEALDSSKFTPPNAFNGVNQMYNVYFILAQFIFCIF